MGSNLTIEEESRKLGQKMDDLNESIQGLDKTSSALGRKMLCLNLVMVALIITQIVIAIWGWYVK